MTTKDAELSEIRARIVSMLELANRGSCRIRIHLLGELKRMVGAVHLNNLTDAELAIALAVFQAAHARTITAPTGDKPVLRLVPHVDASTGGGVGDEH